MNIKREVVRGAQSIKAIEFIDKDMSIGIGDEFNKKKPIIDAYFITIEAFFESDQENLLFDSGFPKIQTLHLTVH